MLCIRTRALEAIIIRICVTGFRLPHCFGLSSAMRRLFPTSPDVLPSYDGPPDGTAIQSGVSRNLVCVRYRNFSKYLHMSRKFGIMWPSRIRYRAHTRFRDISRHLRFFENGVFSGKTGSVELFIGSLSMIWELGANFYASGFSKMSRNVSKSNFETFIDISRHFTSGRVPDFETPPNGPA